jgi:hypothetical protein
MNGQNGCLKASPATLKLCLATNRKREVPESVNFCTSTGNQYRNGNQYGNVPTNSKRTSESHMSPDRGSAVPGLLTTLLSSAQGKLPAVCEGATRDEETPCVTCPSNHNHASPCMVTQGG